MNEPGGDELFEAALVVAAQDAEVAVLAPGPIPGVGYEPVVRAVVHSPAQDPDCMPAR